MTRYASGEIGITEMVERAKLNEPFIIIAKGKYDAHQKMRDVHGAACRKGRIVTTSIMRAIDVNDYDCVMTIVRVTVVGTN